jgi:hypothetical protein
MKHPLKLLSLSPEGIYNCSHSSDLRTTTRREAIKHRPPTPARWNPSLEGQNPERKSQRRSAGLAAFQPHVRLRVVRSQTGSSWPSTELDISSFCAINSLEVHKYLRLFIKPINKEAK